LGADGSGTPSHPGRVLLRVGVGIGYVVGAPPRCERVRHNPRPTHVPLRTRGGCSYGLGLGCGSVVGAPPTVRTGQTQIFAPCSPPFAPGAGAPTVRGWVWFCCRSTASGANGSGTVRTGRSWVLVLGAKVSRSCADFLSCSPVFGVPCLFRLPLVLLLGAALP